MENDSLLLNLRRQTLGQDARGRSLWKTTVTQETLSVSCTALLLCDVWDNHWCRGAAERLDAMVPRMNRVVVAARSRAVQILHAPSDTLEFYGETPALRRVLDSPPVEPPPSPERPNPPLPIDDSDGGSDTGEKPWSKAWSRQHPGIEIDQDRDGISDDGALIYSFLRTRGIENLLILGVHTNMCVLGRSFGIREMIRRGLRVFLVRDLTDAMYNPAMRPYVSHEEGTRLVVDYIEKFWCPSVLSADLLRRT